MKARACCDLFGVVFRSRAGRDRLSRRDPPGWARRPATRARHCRLSARAPNAWAGVSMDLANEPASMSRHARVLFPGFAALAAAVLGVACSGGAVAQPPPAPIDWQSFARPVADAGVNAPTARETA